MGDHVGVVCHFTNAPSTHAPGGELAAAAWLSAAGWSKQPAGDACLAVAGADPNISGARQGLALGGCVQQFMWWVQQQPCHGSGFPRRAARPARPQQPRDAPCAAAVISVAEAQVTHLLRGHARDVAELAAAGGGAPRLLASLSKEGNLRLWDVPREA